MGVYRNKRTGNTVETPCIVTGEDWEPVTPSPKPAPKRKPPKKETKE